MKKNMVIAILLVVIAVLFLSGCTTLSTQEETKTTVAQSAPDFTTKTILGETVSLESLKYTQKPTVVYFMASWCPTCAKNWPVLEELHNQGDVNIVAISIDLTDTAEVLTELANKNQITFPMVAGNPQLMIDFGVKGQATSVGVTSEGKITEIKAGELSLEEFKALVENTNAKTTLESSQNNNTTQMGKAPDFTVTTINGETHSMQEYKQNGKPTLIYFTASWCPICAKNWPAINEVYSEYNDKVNFISISIDPTDTTEVLTQLAEENGLIYPMVPGNPDIMVDFGVKSQATTVGIDEKGNIVFIKEKQAITADEYRKLLNELLAK